MEIQVIFVNALRGSIIEKYLKQGVTSREEIDAHIVEELPQLICDHVNAMLKQAYEEGAESTMAQAKGILRAAWDSLVEGRKSR